MRNLPETEALMTPQEVAAFLAIPVATLHTWRASRTGPKARLVGKHLRYRLSDVERWLEQQPERRDVV